jgi:hypothetical protein
VCFLEGADKHCQRHDRAARALGRVAAANGRGGGTQGEQKGMTITVLGIRTEWRIDLGAAGVVNQWVGGLVTE